jgi:hypothetical protein
MKPSELVVRVDGEDVKYHIAIDPDQMDIIVQTELRRCYEDHAKFWRKEPDFETLSDALLTVIRHYTSESEFEEWYETIKDL